MVGAGLSLAKLASADATRHCRNVAQRYLKSCSREVGQVGDDFGPKLADVGQTWPPATEIERLGVLVRVLGTGTSGGRRHKTSNADRLGWAALVESAQIVSANSATKSANAGPNLAGVAP